MRLQEISRTEEERRQMSSRAAQRDRDHGRSADLTIAVRVSLRLMPSFARTARLLHKLADVAIVRSLAV